ncbi:MAG: threonine synthase, partial [Deltaproteobacteria bacterium]|nr:threonine synthase [Deltaproteobacteria bacterium]
MIRYVSTKGGIAPENFDDAVLQGFAADGGLFVPDRIPTVSLKQLEQWADFDYVELAEAVLSAYIDPTIIPRNDLKKLLNASFLEFEIAEKIPVIPLGDNNIFIMELFHGPTLSFKDVAMGFLIQTMDYFLAKRAERLSLVLATTGDTGPAAAHASVGKKTIDCWPLYPLGMISEEQRRQMTTLSAANVHPVGVQHCPNGGDDLDIVVSRLFADSERKKRLNLSSVNSINWCRVLVQTVHYFHA